MRALRFYLIVFFIVSIQATKLNIDDVDYDNVDREKLNGEIRDQPKIAIIMENPDSKNEEEEEENDEKITNYYPYTPNSHMVDPENEISEELKVLPLSALRKNPWKSCLKKAAKVCKKACKAAYKAACAYRGCEKKLKKSLKKECKTNCKRVFLES